MKIASRNNQIIIGKNSWIISYRINLVTNYMSNIIYCIFCHFEQMLTLRRKLERMLTLFLSSLHLWFLGR
jgi:hypothetical protein